MSEPQIIIRIAWDLKHAIQTVLQYYYDSGHIAQIISWSNSLTDHYNKELIQLKVVKITLWVKLNNLYLDGDANWFWFNKEAPYN